MDYSSQKVEVASLATPYTFQSECGCRRYQATGDGASYAPLINKKWIYWGAWDTDGNYFGASSTDIFTIWFATLVTR